MQVRPKMIANKLKKFTKISKLAQAFAADHPLWSSIIFMKDKTMYLGWRFQVECPPILEVDEPVLVNFDRFMRALTLSVSDKVDIEITDDLVTIHEEDDDGATYELLREDIDYEKHMVEPPEEHTPKKVYKGMMKDIEWATIASTNDRMDYTKYGVILDKFSIMAMDSESAVAFIEKPTGVEIPILLHLPWCNILSHLGEITHMSQWDAGQQNAYLYVLTEDGFNLTIPTLKVYPNPSVESYIKSFVSHQTIYPDNYTVKQLGITTDDAYKFVTLYTEDDHIFLESLSKMKGKTTINLGQGKDMEGESVTISLNFLAKIAKLNGRMEIDLDNMVGFTKKAEYTYAFGLG